MAGLYCLMLTLPVVVLFFMFGGLWIGPTRPPPPSSNNAMNAMETIPVLNRLLGLLCRSLPAYLADVKTLGQPEGEKVRTALEPPRGRPADVRPARGRRDHAARRAAQSRPVSHRIRRQKRPLARLPPPGNRHLPGSRRGFDRAVRRPTRRRLGLARPGRRNPRQRQGTSRYFAGNGEGE